MLSKDIIKLLNEQVNKEMNSSNLYMSMSSWCYTHSLDGAGLFLFDHAAEEYEHAKKAYRLLERKQCACAID